MPDQRLMTQQQMTNTRSPANLPQLNTANLPMTMPPGVIMSPREGISQQTISRNMVESLHHNIPTA